MNFPSRTRDYATRRRRYLIHLSCAYGGSEVSHYIVRIEPWTSRRMGEKERHEQVFADETALVQTVNPLLPCGSDVRDVLGCVESDDGFFYLLHLTEEDARKLGWRT